MTFCKVLATGKNGNDDIIAYEKTTCEGSVSYEIVVAHDGFARLVEKTAKTTWRKKFKEWTKA